MKIIIKVVDLIGEELKDAKNYIKLAEHEKQINKASKIKQLIAEYRNE